ncbi:exocyst complex component EXO70B1-like isoform X2 [Gastrolobium bilobum]|uniref:exocyst complex component EXO70B1-like isoform X2 n=1 Tax=Gastrolobium bilobum TaxID=150636 RepID=UPI002AB30D1B|nr:exocyst complex component EXO70B1-like isoform X2 [Gastrolobium bilobum]
MSAPFRNLTTQAKLWRIVGLVSSVIGMLCYAWSLSSKNVDGKYHVLKISLYGVVSFTIICVMLFARKVRFSNNFLLVALVEVFALMLTSLYNFFSDKDLDKTLDVFSLISNGSFALVLLSIMKQIDLPFEAELLNFYLGCLVTQLMNINLGLVLVGAAYCYFLNVLRSYSDIELEIGTASHEEHVAIQIDTGKGEEREADTDHTSQLYLLLGIEIKNEETVMYPHDFEAKLMEAMASGFVKEHCYHVFCCWRRQVLEEELLLKDLKSIEEVHMMPLKHLKDEVGRWIKASKDAFGELFPNEQHLCNRVFEFSPFADRSFMEVCHEPSILLLNFFANAVASTSRSPQRLFIMLFVFETLNELLPNLESMFSGKEGCVVLNEANRICKRLREAIRGVFLEMENLIRQDPAKVVVSGGGLHPTNRYVMNYLFVACDCWKTLELAFNDEGSLPCSSLSLQVTQVLELLESNLKANSKIYKDSSMSSIFMMNNWMYMVHKVKKCELGKVLGDEWIQKHIVKMRQYLVHYQRSSWDQIHGMLNIDNNESLAHDESAVSWKEKLELFKRKFEEICLNQSTWVVIDDHLREVMKSSLKKNLLPAFENFIARFQNAINPRENMDMHEEFGAQGVATHIDKLFQGKDEHRNPRTIQPTWNVVLRSTQDFYEWRKCAEKTIVNSSYPRCICRNDQGCRARKHVQQIQENPKLYMTNYSGFHTCSVLYMLHNAP